MSVPTLLEWVFCGVSVLACGFGAVVAYKARQLHREAVGRLELTRLHVELNQEEWSVWVRLLQVLKTAEPDTLALASVQRCMQELDRLARDRMLLFHQGQALLPTMTPPILPAHERLQ